MEIWKSVVGFEGFYEVSSVGNIKSLQRKKGQKYGKILKPRKTPAGYYIVALYKQTRNTRKDVAIHKVVATTFLGFPLNDKDQVNHKDLDKSNNAVSNLEWISPAANVQHFDSIKGRSMRGTDVKTSKLTVHEVLEIRRIKDDYTQRELATMYNVKQPNIWAILNNKTWNERTIKQELEKLGDKSE